MFVCVCLAVTEDDVSKAISDGATSVDAVTRSCRAGGDCGACHGMIEEMIEDHLECSAMMNRRIEESAPLVPASALTRRTAA